ncbi:MAG: helix-turn-helix domain-containing protein [Candidatus Paceibacterota bacterium]
MHAYIPTKDELSKAVRQAVKEEIQNSLPEAIRKATRKKWITTDEVMDILQCSRRHVQHLRDSGRLPYRQNGRTIRYDIDEVENYLNRGKVNSNGGQ